ncbi:hypothetical protein JYB62_06840 [Algoriphagus lutimaris]|uniref:hypothetical protein n=1 Tax=Algoriphagus lutimaris TaxID=613197 RepID=UPI00196B96EC|nr:hypothetical protein [Algoriphagus lutimaris]MBN3519715.1 hypothetical protein [Algoriphagus lutimaris]
MRKLIIIIFAVVGLGSCKTDEFYNVTKIIEAPEQIQLDKPFKFKLKLVNKTDSVLPLTLDKDITKSIQFLPNWYCGEDLLIDRTPKPANKKHNYYSVNLEPKDSLTFEMTAELKTYSNADSLLFMIDNYEEDFRLANQNCKDFHLNFGGMWIPGNGPFDDSMEGYNFRTKIRIENTANNVFKK